MTLEPRWFERPYIAKFMGDLKKMGFDHKVTMSVANKATLHIRGYPKDEAEYWKQEAKKAEKEFVEAWVKFNPMQPWKQRVLGIKGKAFSDVAGRTAFLRKLEEMYGDCEP